MGKSEPDQSEPDRHDFRRRAARPQVVEGAREQIEEKHKAEVGRPADDRPQQGRMEREEERDDRGRDQGKARGAKRSEPQAGDQREQACRQQCRCRRAVK